MSSRRDKIDAARSPQTPPEGAARPAGATSRMRLSSAAFAQGQPIPINNSLYGDNRSLPLGWEQVPAQTRSLALLMEDRDARGAEGGPFVHWIVYNIQPSTPGLELDADRTGMPPGSRPGRNDFGRVGYGGPRPPSGTHRYVLRLFALDATLDPDRLGQPTRIGLLEALEGHVLDEAQLEGIFERSPEEQLRI